MFKCILGDNYYTRNNIWQWIRTSRSGGRSLLSDIRCIKSVAGYALWPVEDKQKLWGTRNCIHRT